MLDENISGYRKRCLSKSVKMETSDCRATNPHLLSVGCVCDFSGRIWTYL